MEKTLGNGLGRIEVSNRNLLGRKNGFVTYQIEEELKLEVIEMYLEGKVDI